MGQEISMEWMLMPYRRYADFSGRSRRMEYWMFSLFYLLVCIAFGAVMVAGLVVADFDQTAMAADRGGGVLLIVGGGGLVLFLVGSFIPCISVAVRRFHDQEQSGWMYLLSFIPYVGWIVLIVFMCIDGTRGPNRFGPDPKDPVGADVFA
jgi:uncharacterized membrane protein YhaH (DUF805 family)